MKHSLKPALVEQLRDMARRGTSVCHMLRSLIPELPPDAGHTLMLMMYLKEAFGLGIGALTPIGGWETGTDELSDTQIDDLIMPELEKARPHWDSSAVEKTV